MTVADVPIIKVFPWKTVCLARAAATMTMRMRIELSSEETSPMLMERSVLKYINIKWRVKKPSHAWEGFFICAT